MRSHTEKRNAKVAQFTLRPRELPKFVHEFSYIRVYIDEINDNWPQI